MIAVTPTLNKDSVSAWARSFLNDPSAVVLDTETTGLYGEIIEMAVVSTTGEILINERFRPSLDVEPGALKVHGLTKEVLSRESTFAERWPAISEVIANASSLAIYNHTFDVERIEFTCGLYNLQYVPRRTRCVMRRYAIWVGQWDSRKKDYRWHPLKGGDHSALGDCLATIDLIKTMGAE